MTADVQANMTLTGALDIAHVTALKAQMQEVLNASQGAEIRIHAADITRTDAAGLQLLLALAQHCASHQQDWSWSAVSEVLQADAAGLGLASQLQLHSHVQGGQ